MPSMTEAFIYGGMLIVTWLSPHRFATAALQADLSDASSDLLTAKKKHYVNVNSKNS